MKRCYIAGKITGLSEDEYKPLFEHAKKEVEKLGFEAVCPIDLPHNHEKTWQAYLREDLRAMLCCDLIYVIKNWDTSPGARIEVRTAISIGMPVISQVSFGVSEQSR